MLEELAARRNDRTLHPWTKRGERALDAMLAERDLDDWKTQGDNKRLRGGDLLGGRPTVLWALALEKSDLANTIRRGQVRYHWGEADVIYDQPEKIIHAKDKTEYHLAPKLRPYFEAIDKELLLFSPYFVPGKEGTAFLTELAGRGVRVRILTNSLSSTDVGLVHSGYMKYREKLLRGGVELYELNKKLTREERKQKKGQEGSSKASLHTKSFVFDRDTVFVGSLNLDPRSAYHNTEIGVVIRSQDIGKDMTAVFEKVTQTNAFRLELIKNSIFTG